jgi:hypothetical protein
MNKLRDPKVLIGIGVAVLAFAVLAYVLYGPKGKKAKRPLPTAAGLPAAAAAAKATARSSTNALWPDTPIDFDKVQASLPQWLDAPQRDPFQLSEPVVVAAPTYSPVSQLKLNAVWRQSGGSAAVINGRLVAQGDTIEGLVLERIEADRVWLKGPEKTESLAFGQAQLPPPPPSSRGGLRGIFGPEAMPAKTPIPPKNNKL